MTRLTLGPTYIQWVPQVTLATGTDAEYEANHSPHLVPRLRMSVAIPPLLQMPAWHEQRLLYLYLYPLLCITAHPEHF